MARQSAKAPSHFEQVLVRHVLEKRRQDVDNLSSLLKAPFPSSSTTTVGGSRQETEIFGQPQGRWLLAAQFPKQDWIALFSNAADAEAMFQANKLSRRLEVAWFGYHADRGGWFLKIWRAKKMIIDISQPHANLSTPSLKPVEITDNFLAAANGQTNFDILFQHFDIPLKLRTIQATDHAFQVIGTSGRPVKRGVCGYVLMSGPEVSTGENQASEQLAEAIDAGNPKEIRQAVAAGASLKNLPDSSVSPLLSALFKSSQPQWRQCVEALLEAGCPVDGWPDGRPPIVDAVASFVQEEMALQIVTLLLEHGANVNARAVNGSTALFDCVVYRRLPLVQLLLNHGADPHAPTSSGQTILEWLQNRVQSDIDSQDSSRYAEFLTLLTGETIEQPARLEFTPELQAENERIRTCRYTQLVLEILPRQTTLTPSDKSPLEQLPKYTSWFSELQSAGFELAGHYDVDQQPFKFVTALLHPTDKMEGILTNTGPLGQQLFLEIVAHPTDGTVVSVTNGELPDVLGFRSQFAHCESFEDASPTKLIRELKRKMRKKAHQFAEVNATLFQPRYEEKTQQLYDEVREHLQTVLATPSVTIDGRPPRYERLACYPDLGDDPDSTWNTRRMAESFLKRVHSAQAAEPQDFFEMEMGILSAGDLLALHHLQFVGAPRDLNFVAIGVDVAVRYFQSQANKRQPFADHWCVDELTNAYLLAMLSDRWSDVELISQTLKPSLATSKARMTGDAPRELAKLLLIISSEFREQPIRSLETLKADIKRSRQRHIKQLLETWMAIHSGDQTAFEERLTQVLENTAEPVGDASPANCLRQKLAWTESILLQVAQRRGMAKPVLPETLAGRLLDFRANGVA